MKPIYILRMRRAPTDDMQTFEYSSFATLNDALSRLELDYTDLKVYEAYEMKVENITVQRTVRTGRKATKPTWEAI